MSLKSTSVVCTPTESHVTYLILLLEHWECHKKRISTSQSVPGGAWASRELSEKSVHVYSYFALKEWFKTAYYQVYIFVYNILSEVNLHHRMPAETKEE